MASLRLKLEAEELESRQLIEQEVAKLHRTEQDRLRMASSRGAVPEFGKNNPPVPEENQESRP